MSGQEQIERHDAGASAARSNEKRGRGRPKVEIDLARVADAAAEIFAEDGFEAVSIESVAAKLKVSRATLYRTVPTKDDLLEILFERSYSDLYAAASEAAAPDHTPAEALAELVRVHVRAAVKMRQYMTVFSGGGGLGPDSYARWHDWAHKYENLWRDAVKRAMAAGVLPDGDPIVTTRLLLGMLIWVSRWYLPAEGLSETHIADTAIRLVLGHGAAGPGT